MGATLYRVLLRVNLGRGFTRVDIGEGVDHTNPMALVSAHEWADLRERINQLERVRGTPVNETPP